MQKVFVPQTVIPGARRRVDSDTLMAMSDKQGKPLWDMPPPISYAEHKKWRKHERTGLRIAEPVMVPVYRGTSASYARWVKAQLRRNQRKAAEAQAEVDALNEAEENATQTAEKAIQDLVLNPGGD
jgi:hypothetical protein